MATGQAARDLLAAIVRDDILAWGADYTETYWRCHWCHARGAYVDEEPREEDHAPDCVWRKARELLRGGE